MVWINLYVLKKNNLLIENRLKLFNTKLRVRLVYWVVTFSNIASSQLFCLVIIWILYSVPPTKLLHAHFNFTLSVNFSHLSSILSISLPKSIHRIKIFSYEPLGKLLSCKSIVNEVDDLKNCGLVGSLTTSSSVQIL